MKRPTPTELDTLEWAIEYRASERTVARLCNAGIIMPESTVGRLRLTVLGTAVVAMLSEWEATE